MISLHIILLIIPEARSVDTHVFTVQAASTNSKEKEEQVNEHNEMQMCGANLIFFFQLDNIISICDILQLQKLFLGILYINLFFRLIIFFINLLCWQFRGINIHRQFCRWFLIYLLLEIFDFLNCESSQMSGAACYHFLIKLGGRYATVRRLFKDLPLLQLLVQEHALSLFRILDAFF